MRTVLQSKGKIEAFLLLALPFLPALLWGLHLSDQAYAPLAAAQQALLGGNVVSELTAGLQPFSTPLFPQGVALLAGAGLDPTAAAVVLGTLGWGVSALLIWLFGRFLGYEAGGLTAGLLFAFNPWVTATQGQATGWLIALIWLLANFAARRRFLVSLLGLLFLASLYFRPSQGFSRPDDLVVPLLWSLFLLLASLALEWLARYLVKQERISPSQQETTLLFLGLFLLGAGVWQVNHLWQQFEGRPWEQWQVDAEAAAWLRDHSEPDATLFSSATVAYLAERPRVESDLSRLQELVPDSAPDYIVSGHSLTWQLLREAIWFRLFYEPLETFGDERTLTEIWAFRPPVDGRGDVHLLNARVPDRLSVLGYQVSPVPAQPGSQLKITLYFQTPEATAVDPEPFRAHLRLVSPVDGTTVRQWTKQLPQTLAPEAWQPGQVAAEEIQIPIQPDLESATYLLNLSLLGQDETEFWPFSLNNDVNRLDRIPLGYVTVPGSGVMEGATALSAQFAQGIRLLGYKTSTAAAGEPLEVTLYWQANQTPDDDYVVFVHLVDESGALMANHDGVPAGSRFPTAAWVEGLLVEDTHRLDLPPDLEPGRYEIRAGLYNQRTGQRLPLEFFDHEPSSEDSASLGTIDLP